MSLFDDAVASTASTMNAAGMDASQVRAKMISALSGFGDWLVTLDVANKTRLASGSIYVLFSGTGQSAIADNFLKSVSGSGKIGNTDWGRLIDGLGSAELQQYVDALNTAFEGKLKFGDRPVSVNTLKDIMWNYGSPSFMRNGGASELR